MSPADPHHRGPFVAGMTLRVVREPRMPRGVKSPFAIGDLVICKRVTSAGSILTDKHGGLFSAATFERA